MKASEGVRIEAWKASLFELMYSSRCWKTKLSKTSLKFGLQQSKCDPCIYFNIKGEVRTYVAKYVDDISIFSKNMQS